MCLQHVLPLPLPSPSPSPFPIYWILYAITDETLFFLNVLKRDSFLVNNAHFSRFVQMNGCKCVPTETVDAVA